MNVLPVLDSAGRRRSPATIPGYHSGRAPRNKGMLYPADPPTVEEIIAVMGQTGNDRHDARLRALIAELWRAGLRVQEALALAEPDREDPRVRQTTRAVASGDVRRVKKFADKYALDFPLLADEDHAVAESYGVWVQKSMYGKTYFGNERTTFIVDADGRIAEVLRKVKPAEHDELALAALADAGPQVAQRQAGFG